MTDKNWVALDACPICGEAKGIVMDTRMKQSFDRQSVCTSPELCDKCKEQSKKEGWVIFYETKGKAADFKPTKKQHYPEVTGKYIKFPLSFIKSDAPGYEFLETNRFGFCELEVIEDMQKTLHEYVENCMKEKEEKADD